MASTHLHSHSTPQHPLSHPHALLASAFPPTCYCMHSCSFTLIHVHPTNLCQLHPASHTHCVLTSWMTVDAAQPLPLRPNKLSPHSMHQTLILAVKHCCMLWHPLHPQDLFWECVPHGSLPPVRVVQIGLRARIGKRAGSRKDKRDLASTCKKLCPFDCPVSP